MSGLGAFLVRRTARGIVVLALVTFVMFLLLQAGPGPLELLERNPDYSPADVRRIADERGWDRPWWQQYATWVADFVRGDWGESIYTRRPALEMILERAPVTLVLVIGAQLIAIPLALAASLWLAVRRGSRADAWSTAAASVMMATPPFFIVLLLQLLALSAVQVLGTPIVSTGGSPIDGSVGEFARRLALPMLALSLMLVATWSRYGRSEVGDAIDSEHVSVARAKGLPDALVHRRHALRSALPPVMTLVAIDAAALFTEAVFVEEVFGLQGLGALLIESVSLRDFVVTLDMLVVAGLLMVLANTAADVVARSIDVRSGAAT